MRTSVLSSKHWEKVILCHECAMEMTCRFVPEHTTSPLHCRDQAHPLSPALTALPFKASCALVTITTWSMKNITILQTYFQSYSHHLVMPLQSFQSASSKIFTQELWGKNTPCAQAAMEPKAESRWKSKVSWQQQTDTGCNSKDDWVGWLFSSLWFFCPLIGFFI